MSKSPRKKKSEADEKLDIEDCKKRGDGTGYNCPVCGKKTKDCDKQKCLLPFSGPGLFRAKTNGVLYDFRKLEDFLSERKESPTDIDECTRAPGKYRCRLCKKYKVSEYHKKFCLLRRGTLHWLAKDGKTMMVGLPISSKGNRGSSSDEGEDNRKPTAVQLPTRQERENNDDNDPKDSGKDDGGDRDDRSDEDSDGGTGFDDIQKYAV